VKSARRGAVVVLVLGIALGGHSSLAEDQPQPQHEHLVMTPSDLTWQDGPPSLPAGSFSLMPAHMHHFGRTREETVLQLHGVGPWQINYLRAPHKMPTRPRRAQLRGPQGARSAASWSPGRKRRATPRTDADRPVPSAPRPAGCGGRPSLPALLLLGVPDSSTPASSRLGIGGLPPQRGHVGIL